MRLRSSFAVLASLLAVPAIAAPLPALQFIGEATFSTSTTFGGTTVGGLSGLVFDAQTNQYLAISDDRSQLNPARWYSLSIDLADGNLANGDVVFNGVTFLRNSAGTTFPALSLDPEGIALQGNQVYVSSEGDKNALIGPFVRAFDRTTGTEQSALPVPDKFLPQPGTTSGIRNNLAFESLTRDGQTLITATENALFQDGPDAAVGRQSPARLLTFDLATGQPAAEYLYITDAVETPPVPSSAFATNGLVELLALGDNDFLALERAFSTGVGNTVRLYQFSLLGATDIRGINALDTIQANNIIPVQKTLLFDLAALNLPLDNVEGMTFGPQLANGDRSLVLVSDNNFSNTQFTQFLAFRVPGTAIPEPGTASLCAFGVLSLVGLLRRRRA